MDEQTREELTATIRRLEQRVRELEGLAGTEPLPASPAPRTTARKLLDSRRRYETLLGNLPGMVYNCLADEDWTMLFVSQGCLELTGYQPEDILDSHTISFNEIIHPGDRELVRRKVLQALGQGSSYQIEYRIVTASGEQKWVWEQGTSTPGTEEEILELEGFITDITERKIARAEKRKADQQLRQAQKMEAVGRLAGGVAHDFNNLLTVILGHCELIDLELRPDDPLQKGLREIHEAAERASRLTNQLLSFSRRQVMKPRMIDLNRSVTESEKMLNRLIGEDIDLVVRLQPDIDAVLADPGQVEQVIMNLAVNARDAMPRGGQLTIQTTVEKDPAGSVVVLTVSDTGEGMDPETSSLIFEPFFTTKEAGKGTGLGLSTAYGIVHQSGGEITVESEPGLGTTFRMTFPCQEGAIPESLPRPAITLEQARAAETILVLEDNEALRRLAVRILERCGYSVLEARTGSEARLISAGHDGEIHLLLSDVILPGGSGPETAVALTAQRPKMRTLFMSGYTDDVILDRGAELGAAELLEKPFSPQNLAHRVRSCLAG